MTQKNPKLKEVTTYRSTRELPGFPVGTYFNLEGNYLINHRKPFMKFEVDTDWFEHQSTIHFAPMPQFGTPSDGNFFDNTTIHFAKVGEEEAKKSTLAPIVPDKELPPVEMRGEGILSEIRENEAKFCEEVKDFVNRTGVGKEEQPLVDGKGIIQQMRDACNGETEYDPFSKMMSPELLEKTLDQMRNAVNSNRVFNNLAITEAIKRIESKEKPEPTKAIYEEFSLEYLERTLKEMELKMNKDDKRKFFIWPPLEQHPRYGELMREEIERRLKEDEGSK